MEDGLLQARHDTILYLDGDLAGLRDDLVERMTEPVLRGETDFVKAVGDGENDIGVLRAAGVSVAFQPKTDRVHRAAKHLVKDRLDEVLRFVPPFQETADS